MTTKTPNIADLVATLEQHLAALGDGRDCKSDNEKADYVAAYNTTQRTISGLRNAPADLEKVKQQLIAVQTLRAAWLEKADELHAQIRDAPDWRSVRDARERDAEHDRQQHLKQQLELLNRGTLLRAPGVTYGQMSVMTEHLDTLINREAAAQAALDAHLTQAQALLAEPASVIS